MLWTTFRPTVSTNFHRPAVNTIEQDDAFVLELALPGWAKTDIKLDVDGDVLHVRGERATEAAPEYRRREFGLDKFDKSFHLPETIDVEAIDASLEHGVLRIQLPKLQEALPVRREIAVA